ncbi:MAG: hypothetical protein ACR2H2_13355 [Solirubrobacteraceae bacterium]
MTRLLEEDLVAQAKHASRVGHHSAQRRQPDTGSPRVLRFPKVVAARPECGHDVHRLPAKQRIALIRIRIAYLQTICQ